MIKGKVVLVPFPFDDLSTTKVRPAVCLTDPVGIHRHVVLAFITSRTPDELLETDVMLNSDRSGYPATGLHVSSVLRLHRLMTVATSLIRRELGRLTPDMQEEVDRKLIKLFGFDESVSLQAALGALTSDTRSQLLKALLENPTLQEELESLSEFEVASEKSGEPERPLNDALPESDEEGSQP